MTAKEWQAAGKSDQGRIRKNNEDSFRVDDENGIFVIADGMGGHNAGEVASALAVATAHHILKEARAGEPGKDDGQGGRCYGEETLEGLLKAAFHAAHYAIREKAKGDPILSGMGTTLVVLQIRDDQAYFCHAGDSRAYLFRDNLRQLTRDHTVGDYLVAIQGIPRAQVPARQWHILMRALGTEEEPEADFSALPLRQGDMILLCTDGLTDMLPDEEISTILAVRADDLSDLAARLVTAANDRGGRDNVSLILVRYGQ